MIDRERHSDREDPANRPQGSENRTPGGPFADPSMGKGSGSQGFQGESSGPGGRIVDLAQQKGGQAADQAQQKTQEIVEQARQQARSSLSEQKDRAAEGLDSVAQAVRQTGAQLRNQQQAGFAEYADRTADQIEHFSGYLRENDLEDMVHEVESFARRQPLLFLGGALAAGFLGARFLKSSSPSGDLTGDHSRGSFGATGANRPSYPQGRAASMGGYPPSGSRPVSGAPTQSGTTAGPGSPSSTVGTGSSGTAGPPSKPEDLDAAA